MSMPNKLYSGQEAAMQTTRTQEQLADYLGLLQTNDIVGATQAARRKSMRMLEDQGISAIAILISNVIAEAIDKPEIMMDKSLHAAYLR